MPRRRFVTTLSLLFLIAAQGQVDEPTVNLEVHEVVDDRLSPVSVAQLNAENELKGFSGAATILDAEILAAGRATTVAETLRGVPGVFAQSRFGPLDTRLSIRGSGIVRTGHGKGVQLLYGIIPINQADGNFDVHALDAFAVDYIDIRRGGHAFQTGNATLGGSLAWVPLTGYSAPRGRLRAEGGSYASWSVNALTSFEEQPFDGVISAGYGEGDGYRDHSEYSVRRVSGNLGWQVGEASELRLVAMAVDARSKWPGALNRAQFEANPRQAAANAVQRSQGLDIEQVITGLQWNVGSSDNARLTAGVGYNYKFEYHPTPGVILELPTHDVSVALQWQQVIQEGWRYTLGVHSVVGTGDERRFSYAGGPTSPLSSVKGTLNLSGERFATTTGAFLHSEYDVSERLTVDLGLQGVVAQREFDRKPGGPNPAVSYDEFYWRLNPRVGASYAVTPDAALFASYTESFEPPTFFDLAGNADTQPDRLPRLDAQVARTVELGTRGTQGPWRWEAAVFHSWISDEHIRLDPAAGFGSPIINAPKVLRTGVESGIGLDQRLSDQAKLSADVVYTGSFYRFDDNPEFGDNEVAGVPVHHLFATVRLTLFDQWEISPSLEAAPESQWVDNANTFQIDGYAVVGLRLGYTSPRGHWRAYVEARNLADESYSAVANVTARANPNHAAWFPADGRSIFGGVEFRW